MSGVCGRIADDYHNILGTTQERRTRCERHTLEQKVRQKQSFTLTDPEVVEPLAHGATLVWDLIEVLVETWLERDESRQGRKVVFWESNSKVSATTQTPTPIHKEIQPCRLQTGRSDTGPGCEGWSSPAMVTEASSLPLADTYADLRIRRLRSNCRERTEVTLPVCSHSTGHNPPQAPLGMHRHQGRH